MPTLTHRGLLSVGPAWGLQRRGCTQHLATFPSQTFLFSPFLFSHRDKPTASYYLHIWRLFYDRFPEKPKTLLDFEGAPCWTVSASSIFIEKEGWPLTLASVTSPDNSNSKHSWRTTGSRGFRCSHLIFPTCPRTWDLVLQKRKLSLKDIQERLSVDTLGVRRRARSAPVASLQKTSVAQGFCSRLVKGQAARWTSLCLTFRLYPPSTLIHSWIFFFAQ